jgi:hypothetical protein
MQGGTASPCFSPSLPFLTTLQPATSALTPYTLVASLDTEPVASSYSDEIALTRRQLFPVRFVHRLVRA